MTHTSDPLVETDRSTQRRSTFLVAAIGVIVMVVVVLLILKAQGPEDQPADERPVSPSARLSHSSGLLDGYLPAFQQLRGTWPTAAAMGSRDVSLSAGTHENRYDPGLDAGVSLTWYRGNSDRFAYCLTYRLRHLSVVATATSVQKRERDGACPAASLTPDPDAG